MRGFRRALDPPAGQQTYAALTNSANFCAFTGGAPGEEVELSWKDNKGGSESASATIS